MLAQPVFDVKAPRNRCPHLWSRPLIPFPSNHFRSRFAPGRYTIHRKRTNLVLDVQLLQQATRVLHAKTYSAAVNQALQEVLRFRKTQSLGQLFGSHLWDGDLATMRQDVLVQREMERGRSPLVSIPPFGRGFSRHEVYRSDVVSLRSAEAKPPRSGSSSR
ncbi:MAG: type II toxin-antitoxin system VapB family antitoxin [Acidimicrobiia bacterium]|nr:type II toxin-antitoxin system VapB family antitoxin [Acidimicrobiia bacterium]